MPEENIVGSAVSQLQAKQAVKIVKKHPVPIVDEKYMKCLLLMSFSHNDNYCHANVPLLAVPMQTNVNIDWYPNSLIAPLYVQ